MQANEAQRAQWNAEHQVRTWPRRERITVAVTAPLLKALAPTPGETVLDVGCGGGLAALDAARAVAPAGSVTGFDLSVPLVGLASRRAAEANADNVAFIAGDAQTDAVPGGPFDAVMSQFGVMFFADPVAAFSNIRKHLRPGGRMAFACWQSAAKNTWFPGPVLAPFQSPPPPTAHGGPAAGPLAFGDPAYVERVLVSAGFEEFGCEALSIAVAIPEDSIFDRETVDNLRLDAERAAQASAALEAFKAPMLGQDGLLRFTIAPQIVRARNQD